MAKCYATVYLPSYKTLYNNVQCVRCLMGYKRCRNIFSTLVVLDNFFSFLEY